jgi:hypothetical protein
VLPCLDSATDLSMNNAIAEPVSGIINAFHRGTIKAQRICKAAQRAAGPNVEDTVVPAQSLGTALAEYEASLRYAYDQHVKDVGKRYVRAFQIDRENRTPKSLVVYANALLRCNN